MTGLHRKLLNQLLRVLNCMELLYIKIRKMGRNSDEDLLAMFGGRNCERTCSVSVRIYRSTEALKGEGGGWLPV